MKQNFRSIRQKLIVSGSALLIGTFLVLLSVVIFLSVLTADKQLKNTEESIRSSLLAKGKTLISNNSQALKGMVADNAFSAVQELVSSTVRDDVDIEYGVFMDVDLAPWVMANSENPKGAIDGRMELDDEVSQWAASIEKSSVNKFDKDGTEFYEFAAPVVEDDEILGFIRYGFSSRRMVDSLNTAREESEGSLMRTILIIGGLGLLAGIFGFTFNRQIATKITNPLRSLTSAAATIAEGDYSKSIQPETNDEIGLLADNFNTMRVTIRKKMKDLSELNEVGEVLAGITEKTSALEAALTAMQSHTNVKEGSVYLYNDEGRIEVKAVYPVKISHHEAHKFSPGEGVLGTCASEKKIIYVEDTSRNNDYFNLKPGEVPKSLLCVPLIDNEIVIGVMNFSGEVGKVTFEDSDYEYASSVARLLVITLKNIHMREEIEEYNRSLEEKIKERTAALQEKTNDIMSMMENMHQGLFTIVQGGTIHPEYAAYLEHIFETKSIAGRSYMDLMFAKSDLGSDVTNQVETAVSCLIGEDEMMYDFNSHLLATEFSITLPSGKEKIIELDWDPIIFDEVIQKLMVTVRDVTEIKALQKEAEAQKRELEIIGEILALDEAKFNQFIQSANKFNQENRDNIEANDEKDLDVIATLFRNMHTIKGNARTYGLKYITDVVHEAEETYDKMRKEEDFAWDKERLIAELDAVEEKIGLYHRMATEKLGREENASEDKQTLSQDMVDRIVKNFRDIDLSDVPEPARNKLQLAIANVSAMNTESFDSALSEILKALPNMAKELGKVSPQLSIETDCVRVKPTTTSILNNVFSHLIRNSMDHGIESPEERESKGKNAQGTISIRSWADADNIKIALKDDGRGLGVKRLKEKALESGKFQSEAEISMDAIVSMMFESGMSTAEKVTEISGRGVGMDAVKRFMEENGGDITIQVTDKDTSKAFVPMETVLTLPSSMFLLLEESA